MTAHSTSAPATPISGMLIILGVPICVHGMENCAIGPVPSTGYRGAVPNRLDSRGDIGMETLFLLPASWKLIQRAQSGPCWRDFLWTTFRSGRIPHPSGSCGFTIRNALPPRNPGVAAMTCLVIAATIILCIQSTTPARHTVIASHGKDAVFVPAVTEIQLMSTAPSPPPESASRRARLGRGGPRTLIVTGRLHPGRVLCGQDGVAHRIFTPPRITIYYRNHYRVTVFL
jgi:hypothetical protein